MVERVVVELSDREYQILQKLDEFEGDSSQKLKELFINYLSQTPRLKAGYHLIKLDEKKDYLLKVLESIYQEYEAATVPFENWPQEKYDNIQEELLQIEVIRPMGGGRFAPTYLFKKPWLTVYNSTSKVFPDLDEFSQAYLATIYMLNYLSRGTFEDDLIKDATIILNEMYMMSYAVAKKRGRETKKGFKEKKVDELLISPGDDLTA